MSKHVLGSLHDIENINLTIFSRNLQRKLILLHHF